MTDSEKLKQIREKLENGNRGNAGRGEDRSNTPGTAEGGSSSGIYSPTHGDRNTPRGNTRTYIGNSTAGNSQQPRRVIGGKAGTGTDRGFTQAGNGTTFLHDGSKRQSVGGSEPVSQFGNVDAGTSGNGGNSNGTYSRSTSEQDKMVVVNPEVKADFTGEDSKPFIVDVPPVQEKRRPGRPVGSGTKSQPKTPAKSTSPSVASFEFILESGFALAAMGFGEHWARPYDEYGSSLKAVAEPLKRSFDRLAPSEIVDLDKYLDIVAVIVGMSMLVKPSLDIEKNRKRNKNVPKNPVNASPNDQYRGGTFGGLNTGF